MTTLLDECEHALYTCLVSRSVAGLYRRRWAERRFGADDDDHDGDTGARDALRLLLLPTGPPAQRGVRLVACV